MDQIQITEENAQTKISCHLILLRDRPFCRSGRDKICLILENDRANTNDWDRFDILFIDPGDDLVGCIPDARLAFHQFDEGILTVVPVGQVSKGDLSHIQPEVVHGAKRK